MGMDLNTPRGGSSKALTEEEYSVFLVVLWENT